MMNNTAEKMEDSPSFAPQPTVVVLDCATLYGAFRWFTEYHEKPDPRRRFHGQHSSEDDFASFLSLAHALILYDDIMYDTSSVAISQYEWYNHCLVDFEQVIEVLVGRQILHGQRLLSPDVQPQIQLASCRLLKKRMNADRAGEWQTLSIPAAYRSPEHVDSARYSFLLKQLNIPTEALGLALFCYRGLACAGMTRNLGLRSLRPSVYLAAPQRISALRYLTSSTNLKLGASPDVFQDLFVDLDLPNLGYDFSDLDPALGDEFSPVALAVFQRAQSETRADTLRWIGELRNSSAGISVRANWSDRISDPSAEKTSGQSLNRCIVIGDVSQTQILPGKYVFGKSANL